MIKRVIVVIAIACALGACSGSETSDVGEREDSTGDTGHTAVLEEVSNSGGVTETVSAEPVAADSAAVAPDTTVADDEEPAGDGATLTDSVSAPVADDPEPPGIGSYDAPEPVVGTSAYGLRVLRAYVCKGIDQSEPTEAGKSFIPEEDGVLRLCCFSEIAGAGTTATVFHIWYWGDREMARVELAVRSARWRTWSTKRILDEWRGEWHVDVTDRDGTILSRLDFSVE